MLNVREGRMNNVYKHTVQYYETDKMGITHHSNYIRWMEEARVYFLAEMGWPFKKIEELGVVSPVTSIDCKYKLPTTFEEVVDIEASLVECKSFKFVIEYIMKNAEGKVVFEGHSAHCFLDMEGNIVRVNKDYPELYQAFMNKMNE